MPDPSRGEVWMVDFDPPIGSETNKIRPAVVVSDNSLGALPLKIVVPITKWKTNYARFPWFTHLPPTKRNGLRHESGADGFQVKSVSTERFENKIGEVTEKQLANIAASVALCVGYNE
ncbi:type II toxin-antitoxin system PemK/MazF family toxin [Candidatus Neomarinimicrobiota bacterium]